MQIEGLGDITKQCESVLESKRQELVETQAQIGTLKAEIAALVKLTKVAASLGDITVAGKPAGRRQAALNPRGPKGDSRGMAVLNLLRETDKSLDLGTICRKLNMEDNAQNRTKVSAALTPMVSGPQSPVIRVSVGVYAARRVGAVELPGIPREDAATA